MKPAPLDRKPYPSGLTVWLTLAAVLLAAHVLNLAYLQGPLCIDDAYISFRYAGNLAAGQGVVFNPGEQVEGYTNFGWVVLMALVTKLGLDVAATARLLNGLLGLTLLVVSLKFLGSRARAPTGAVMLAGALMAADGSLARWSQDGMETVLFALLVFAAAALEVRDMETPGRFPWSGFVFALATLVRPEGVLFFGVTFAFRVVTGWRDRAALERAFLQAAGFAALVIPHLLWRWMYYGDLLPNTFYAKVGGTAAQAARGGRYILRFFVEGRWPLLLLSGAALLSRRGRRMARWQVYFLTLGGALVLYVLLIGGDWMGMGRFLVPIMALLYLPIAETAAAVLDPGQPPGGYRIARRVAALVLLTGQFVLTSWLAEGRSIRAERRFSDSRAAVAAWLRENADPGDTLLSNEIGQLAFFSGLHTDDLYGLTDPRIARMKPASMGEGKPGHEKFDLEYSFARRPTWVCIPGIGRSFAAWGAGFPPFADYRPVTLPEPLPRHEYQVLLRRRP